jgi:ADP-heptose:LPS heptosyltransferase
LGSRWGLQGCSRKRRRGWLLRQKAEGRRGYQLPADDATRNLEHETLNTPPADSFFSPIPNVRDFFMSLLSKEGIVPLLPYRYPFDIKHVDIETVEKLVNHHGLTDTTKNLAFVVGAKRPQNRWPIGYFDQVIQHFVDKGYCAILIGGPEDTELAKQMSCYPQTVDLTGQLSPIQSGLMFQHCALAVSNDTGPLHLAYSFGTRVVALFSSRDYPTQWFPPEERSYVFRNNHIACSECFTTTCSNNLCMQGYKPNDVIAKVDEMLKELEI